MSFVRALVYDTGEIYDVQRTNGYRNFQFYTKENKKHLFRHIFTATKRKKKLRTNITEQRKKCIANKLWNFFHKMSIQSSNRECL